MRTALLFIIAFFAPVANSAPFSDANIENGKTLFAEYECNNCHIAKVGGDGSAIFTRTRRKASTSGQLLQQIDQCSSRNHLDEQEKRDLAGYLNKTYYHFMN